MAISNESHTRFHESPRISANELAKFMITADPGRLGIIRRARESTTPIRTRYSVLRDGITSYLTDIRRPAATLANLENEFERRRDDPRASEFVRQDADLSLDALATFRTMQNQLGGYRFIDAPETGPLQLGDVAVSVHLPMLAIRERRGAQQFGGVLVRLTKPDDAETEQAASRRREMGRYAATLALMRARSLNHNGGSPHHELSMSIDVQCGDLHTAPRHYVMRVSRLEAACRFIAAMWAAA